MGVLNSANPPRPSPFTRPKVSVNKNRGAQAPALNCGKHCNVECDSTQMLAHLG
jgi:hypothetical protein